MGFLRAETHSMDTLRIQFPKLRQGAFVARSHHDARRAEGQRQQRRANAQGAGGAEDQDALARPQRRLANRRVRGAQVAEAGGLGETQALRQAHEIGDRRRHVLPVAGKGVFLEDCL
ncbi:hypothetical protein D3C85_1620490 [compost metagenome]